MILLLIGLSFLFFMLAGYLLLLKGRRMGEKGRDTGRGAYACGETLQEAELSVGSSNFYATFRESLEPAYRFFGKVQDGSLTNYLIVIVAVLAFISLIAAVML